MTHDEMLKEIERLNQEKMAAQEAEAKAAWAKNRKQQIAMLEFDINKRKNRLAVKYQNLQTPKIVIQDKATEAKKEQWCSLSKAEKDLALRCKGFNPFFLKFGKMGYSFIGLVFTLGIGGFWVWRELGLDAMGSTWLTVVLAATALLIIDFIGYLAVLGSLTSVGNFLVERHYRRLLEVMLSIGFGLGMISFVCNAILRIMEAGL